MSTQNNQAKSKRSKYKTFDEKTRLQIIDRICIKGQNIKDVSHEMNINISTCKAILKVYQEQGRVGKKKQRNKIVNVIETYSFYNLDGMRIEQIAPIKIQESKAVINKDEEIDKILEDKCKDRAQTLLNETIQTKKKVEQVLSQQQLLQAFSQFQNNIQNCYMNGFPPQSFPFNQFR